MSVSAEKVSTETSLGQKTSESNLCDTMKISIVNKFTAEGSEYVEWDLWEGPADSQDHAHGYATDLITSFSKLLEWRERILADYTADYTDFNTTDETDRVTTD